MINVNEYIQKMKNRELTYTYYRLKKAFKKRVKLKPIFTINRKVYKVDIGIKSRKLAINIKSPPNEQMIADFQTINYIIMNVDVVGRNEITELINQIKQIRL